MNETQPEPSLSHHNNYQIEPSKCSNIFSIQSLDNDDDYHIGSVNSFDVLLFGEELRIIDGVEYRLWDWEGSLMPNLMENDHVGVRSGFRLLCLEAMPVDVSYCSEIVESHGKVFAVFRSVEMYEICVKLAQRKENVIPILCDSVSFDSSLYESIIGGSVDSIYLGPSVLNCVEVLNDVGVRFFDKSKDGNFIFSLKAPEGANTHEYIRNHLKECEKLHFIPAEFHLVDNFFAIIGNYRPDFNTI